MINNEKIGVIAGTPIDTQMGVDFVTNKGIGAVGRPTATSSKEQNLLQFLHPDSLTKKVLKIVREFKTKQIYRTMIYCNSLSAAIDIDYLLNTEPEAIIITPLDIYKRLAYKYKKIALWAANGQCLSAIEHVFYKENSSINIMGISMLPVINAIEKGASAKSIVNKFKLTSLICEHLGVDGLVLGCTHLPFLQSELEKIANIPIIDPAEHMLEYIMSSTHK